jgi:hypothetical protein
MRERGLAPPGQVTALLLVRGGQDQRLVAQQPQHGGLGHHVPVVTGHRPYLVMPPRGMGQGMRDHRLADR